MFTQAYPSNGLIRIFLQCAGGIRLGSFMADISMLSGFLFAMSSSFTAMYLTVIVGEEITFIVLLTSIDLGAY